jgi:hypothetical protein
VFGENFDMPIARATPKFPPPIICIFIFADSMVKTDLQVISLYCIFSVRISYKQITWLLSLKRFANIYSLNE